MVMMAMTADGNLSGLCRARDLTRFERDGGEGNRQRENGRNPAPHHHRRKYNARAANVPVTSSLA
jgi:hypothetical protein